MMRHPAISAWQFFGLFAVSFVTVPLSLMPNGIFHTAKQDAWIGLLIGFSMSFLLLLGLFWLTLRQKVDKEPPARLSVIHRFFLAVHFLFLLVVTIVTVRNFIEVVHGYFLVETPMIVLSFILLLTAGYAAWTGLSSIMRLGSLVFLFAATIIMLMPLTVLEEVEIRQFMPILAQPPLSIAYAAWQSFGMCSEYLFLFFFVPYIKFPTKRRIAVYVASMLMGFLLLLSMVIQIFFVFGPHLAGSLLIPAVELVKYITLYEFWERVDVALVAVWTVMITIKTGALLWLCHKHLGVIFGLKDSKGLVVPLVLMMSPLSIMFSDNVSEFMFFYHHLYVYIVLIGAISYIGTGKATLT
ncbi:GerAB/ArcD/ProY family transporter [Brevibacillus dissolubilis]|uniref:GerAB/ArcD/ProY family transporter n=1 Tax=Brevibacillus dissolubilis TaxID=1844116 RepID=UPI0011173B5C|nr:GerAB/ArcD/ProY family transporter [Brevibacillus dissolubilis]